MRGRMSKMTEGEREDGLIRSRQVGRKSSVSNRQPSFLFGMWTILILCERY